ncbi:hypothetical protein [Streptomyces sp. CA-132043]|uniref:hypothetical protein n=1 Tax=Streptomyces sp. CA-132043 TaxID=3240048 RepID=UPI003D91CA6B
MEEVRRGVANEQGERPGDPEVRKDMLDRISALGKGRFAQRLAAHIGNIDLPARLRTVAGITDASASLDTPALRRLGPAAYLFLALDDISQKARGTSLFATPPETSIHPRSTDAADQ